MPRKLSKPRPKQGTRLLELRQAAGLTQMELARQVGEPQANIAFWERSEKPPRSDALPKLAQALSVEIRELLVVEEKETQARPAGRPPKKRLPSGKVWQTFEQVAQLPRRQQEKIMEMVAAFVLHYEHTRLTDASK